MTWAARIALPVARARPRSSTALVGRARSGAAAFEAATQAEVDEVVTAAAWAIVDPEHNRALAELAVRDTGLGNVGDKMAKNRRKTIGLLRDLAGRKSVGVIAEDSGNGLVEIARPVGVVGAITPSTNPAATPANNIINALKGATPSSSHRPPRAHPRCRFCSPMCTRVGPDRRAARPGATAARAGDARAHCRADAPGGPGRRNRLADQCARRLRERHPGDRRRARQRGGHRRRDRRPRQRRRQDRRVEDLRQRDQLLVGEQRDRGRGDRRRRCSRAGRGRRRPARGRRGANARARDVCRRAPAGGIRRPDGAGDRPARRPGPRGAARRALSHRCRGGGWQGASVLGRETLARAGLLSRARLRRRHRAAARAAALSRVPVTPWACTRATKSARSTSAIRCPSAASSSTRRIASPPAARSTTRFRSRSRWAAEAGAATASPTT